MEYQYIVNPMTNRKCRVDSAMGKKLIRMYKKALNGGGKRSRDDDPSEMPSTKRYREQFLRLKKRSREDVSDAVAAMSMTSTKRHRDQIARQKKDIVGYTNSMVTSGRDDPQYFEVNGETLKDNDYEWLDEGIFGNANDIYEQRMRAMSSGDEVLPEEKLCNIFITDKPIKGLSDSPIRLYYVDESKDGDSIYVYTSNPENPSEGEIFVFADGGASSYLWEDWNYFGSDIVNILGRHSFYKHLSENNIDDLMSEDELIRTLNIPHGIKFCELVLIFNNYDGWKEDHDEGKFQNKDHECHFGRLDKSDGWSKDYYWLFNDSSKEWNLKRYLETGEKPDQ